MGKLNDLFRVIRGLVAADEFVAADEVPDKILVVGISPKSLRILNEASEEVKTNELIIPDKPPKNNYGQTAGKNRQTTDKTMPAETNIKNQLTYQENRENRKIETKDRDD